MSKRFDDNGNERSVWMPQATVALTIVLAFGAVVSAYRWRTVANELRDAEAQLDHYAEVNVLCASHIVTTEAKRDQYGKAFDECVVDLTRARDETRVPECPNAISQNEHGSHIGIMGVECAWRSDVVWVEAIQLHEAHFLGGKCATRWFCGQRSWDERDIED